MKQLPIKRNWGASIYNEYPLLVRQLDAMYSDISNAVLKSIQKRVIESSNPPSSDQVNRFFDIGDIWIRTDSNSAWIMTSRTNDTDVTWTLIT